MSLHSRCTTRLLASGLLCAATLWGVAPVARAQQPFASPEAAASALVDAVATNDSVALSRVLGAGWQRFIPTAGLDKADAYEFLAAWAQAHRIVRDSPDRAHLAIGKDDWTLPIPMVQRAGSWQFDARAGAEEIRTRRIGRNELAAMQAVLAYYDAQKDYASEDRDGDGVLEYAQRIISTPGRKDGLYWAELPGEDESPLGPIFGDDKPGDDYHGYNFRVLKAQGLHAPGGAYDYRIAGRMTAGFAVVAWPARYGDTGVMTFIASHAGKLYERDLGARTGAIAGAMSRFDPDAAWKEVMP